MKMGHIVVARLGDAGGFMVGEVVGLLPVVWVEGSEDVEGSGDLEVHECGGSKKGDTFEPLYVVAGKKRKVGEGKEEMEQITILRGKTERRLVILSAAPSLPPFGAKAS